MKLQAILRNEPKKITTERQGAINRPARASAAYTAISLFSKACAFVFTPIFTRLLTAEEYGEFSLFLSCLSLLTVVGGLELSGGVITRAYQRRPDDSHLTLLIAAGISLASTAAASTVIYLFRNAAFGELHFGNAYILLFTASISTSVIGLYLSKCRFLYKWKPALAAALLQSAVSPILGVALILTATRTGTDRTEAKALSYTLPLLLAAALVLGISVRGWLLSAKRSAKVRGCNAESGAYGALPSKKGAVAARASSRAGEQIAFLLKLSLPLLPYYASVIAISQSDKIAVSSFFGSGALGKYSVAYSAGLALSALTSGAVLAVCPWIMRKVRSGDGVRIRVVLRAITSICAPAVVCFAALLPEAFSLLAPPEYSEALPIAFISALIPLPLALTQCATSIAIAKERISGVVICGISCATLAIAMNFILTPRLGMTFAATATAAAYLALAALGIANAQRVVGLPIIDHSFALRSALILIFSIAALEAFHTLILFRIVVLTLALYIFICNLKKYTPLVRDK